MAEPEIDLSDLVLLVVDFENEADFGLVGERVGSQALPRLEHPPGPKFPASRQTTPVHMARNRRADEAQEDEAIPGGFPDAQEAASTLRR